MRRSGSRRGPRRSRHGLEDIHDALIIREGAVFLLSDEDGNVPVQNGRGFGLYHADTRHLSGFHFSFDTAEPVVLLSTAELGFASEHVLTNPPLKNFNGGTIPGGTIEIRRLRVIEGGLIEQLTVTNYHSEDVSLRLVYALAVDFANIFEVRGFRRRQRGEVLSPEIPDGVSVHYAYRGLDGRLRCTDVLFHPRPDELSPQQAVFSVRLSPKDTWEGTVRVSPDPERPARPSADVARLVRSYERWRAEGTQIETDNEFFNDALRRSFDDLRMLWTELPEGERYPAAGTPWFDALFGRDSLIIGLQTIAYRPEFARETLRALARNQGTALDDWRDEEPGKILHEMRRGEVSMMGELPFRPYYGSIDATLLFLLLFAEYLAWTADDRLFRDLKPNVLAALDWVAHYGDRDGDGYVEYEKRSPHGLVNQGWKDSDNAIVHADGALVDPPVALAEVQAYLYAAKNRIGTLFQRRGSRQLGSRLRREAAALRRRFNADFWLDHGRGLALALDGGKQPCASVASNAGHALWCGILDQPYADGVCEALMSDAMFSGWGIRTLSRDHPSFNPLGYHVGTVWPHDSAIAAFGCKVHGREDLLNRIATALFEAALAFPDARLPELFGGQARLPHRAPVPYPVACRPQGWAAGALPMVLHAMLGLQADAPNGVLRVVRPRLPEWLNIVRVRELRVGKARVDLDYRRRGERTSVDVVRTDGRVRVVMARRWA